VGRKRQTPAERDDHVGSVIERLYAEQLKPQLGPEAAESVASLLRSRGLSPDADQLLLAVLESAARLPASTPVPPERGMSTGELEVLRAGGFSAGRASEQETRYRAADPVTRGVADYATLIAGSRSVSDVAALLGVEPSRIRQRLGERSLYGVKQGRGWRLPAFQLTHDGLVPNVGSVLLSLPADLHPIAVQRWFTSPCVDLLDPQSAQPIAPRQWLCCGYEPTPVVELARAL
jgi:hypothetical protein